MDSMFCVHPFAPLPIAGYAEISPFWQDCDRTAFARHGIACPPEIRRSVERRRREYLHGRLCARTAIATATGRAGAVVPSGLDRRPLFPAPLRGSITHTTSFAAAACVYEADGSIGIDAEPHIDAEVARRISPLVASERELAATSAVSVDPHLRLTAIYSAKEALFKALTPLVHGISEFHQSEWLHFDPGNGRFTLALSTRLEGGWGGHHVYGQLVMRAGMVLTAVLVPAQSVAL